MHIYRIELPFNLSETDNEMEYLKNLTSIWYNTGQIIDKEMQLFSLGNKSNFIVRCLEKDSLDVNNKYSNQFINKLIDIKFDYEYLGNDSTSIDVSICENLPKSYILYPGDYSPLRSGDDFSIVPLYRFLRKFDIYEDYDDFVRWRNNYSSLYQLWRDGSINERFSNFQLTNINSKLTKIGMGLCDRIKKISNKNAYYYLFNSSNKKRKKCPNCLNEISYNKNLFDLFNFKCEKCLIISE